MKAVNSLLNVLMLVCPALVFVFLSQPQITVLLGQATDGYSLINFEAEGMALGLTICIVATMAMAGLLVLTSIIGMFRNGRPGVFRGILTLLLMVATVATAVIIAREYVVENLTSVGFGAIVSPCLAGATFIAYNFSRAITAKKKNK